MIYKKKTHTKAQCRYLTSVLLKFIIFFQIYIKFDEETKLSNKNFVPLCEDKRKMKKCIFLVLLVIFFILFIGCDFSIKSGGYDGVMNIYYNETRQEIDGFGGSNAWTGLPGNVTAANEVVKLLYSRTEGAGFTILRNRIPFRERLPGDDTPSLNDGFIRRKSDNTYDYTVNANGTKTFNLNWNSWDLSGTRNLISRIKGLGVNGPENLTVMSTPWTPPNNRVTQWKKDVVGVSQRLDGVIDWSKPDIWGTLKREHYNDYADLLADYAKNFETQMGAPLVVLSVQNEPNMKVGYESAYKSGVDIRDFLKVIGERFPLKDVSLGINALGIMAPEYENYDVNFDEMIKPSLDDSAANSVLTHIALHQYNAGWDSSDSAGTNSGISYFPKIAASGKRFWQTEISTLNNSPHEPKGTGIDNALFYARMIHFDMTLAQTNAFLFWWLWGNSNSNDADFSGSLISVNGSTVNVAKRLYTMGQYSRFIRPGWYRIASDTNPVFGVYSSAYKIDIILVTVSITCDQIKRSLNAVAKAYKLHGSSKPYCCAD
jgi:O-glycosyl hydrolase